MRVFGDRFLLDDGEAVDLATGELVRLTIERYPAARTIAERTHFCDVAATLRHPLLVPLLDYGTTEDTWFEAHALRPPLKTGAMGSRRLALHLVRFLRAHGLEISASMCARHVRPAIEKGSTASPTPIGWRLAWRAAVDAVRVTMESGGPPGVTCVTLSGAVGCGLRTARVLLARAARLCGFVVVDSRFPFVLPHLRERHCCVFDWLPGGHVLPTLLAHAATAGTARHLWLRFSREPVRGTCAIPLDPLSPVEMTTMLYRDPEHGPEESDVRAAIRQSQGLPGSFIQRLATEHPAPTVLMVHEASPRYAVSASSLRPDVDPHSDRRADAGVRRLMRVLRAAEHVAGRGRHSRALRLLRRCVDALVARGATARAAEGSIVLGDLLLRRGEPDAALRAYERARDLQAADFEPRLLLSIGRAHALNGSKADAEAVFRAVLGHEDDALRREGAARLADVLVRAESDDRAEELLREHGAERTPLGALVLARIHLRAGNLGSAAACARDALTPGLAPDVACEAHLVLARIQLAMGERSGATEEARQGMRAARTARDRALQWLAWAVRVAADPVSPRNTARRQRLVATASSLPAACAGDLRAILASADHGRPVARIDADVLETLLGLTEAAPDDESAVLAVVCDVHERLGATSTAAWTAEEARQVAAHGRAWPGAALVRLVVNSGACAFTPGVITEAAEPVRAGGRTIGCIGARWTAGKAPAEARARAVLRVAAAAVAPAIAALNAPRPTVVLRTDSPDALLGAGPAAERLRALIARAAGAPFPVLIEGESGSGKELVARAIHARSGRRGRRFCALNCAAITDDLLEAELFGHARGAFTGAASERAGLFEDADQGTLFLDEAAELSARAQAKLLRVLQEGEVRRVGENLPRRVDVRIVAATNRPLEREVEGGRFRQDLRFRLDVIRIVVPPLRERADEIPALAERIWRDAAARVGTRATLAPDLVHGLARYSWPGNVRELQNVLAALAVHAPPRGRVPSSLLPPRIAETAGRSPVGFDEARVEFERRFVQAALARAAGRKGIAAAQLGVSRQGLDKMLKRLGIG
jgi:DNA-binding NtrC family response regulator/tetratricopeptide (TPR) repeat protein